MIKFIPQEQNTDPMNILVLGSGGREHALAWKIAQSPLTDRLYIAPGNAGTAQVGTNVHLSPEDFPAIEAFILSHEIHMLVVGPEVPLVKGIYDYFRSQYRFSGLFIVGPSREGALLEGSKAFAKTFMEENRIPTARHRSFGKENMEEAKAFLKELEPPYVLKADGLAAGKGVLILEDYDQAVQALKDMFGGKFGTAGSTVVVEEYLHGIECSVFVLTDGESYLLLPEAKDYKRIGEDDTGLNTGGMGAVSPVPFADGEFLKKVEERIIRPTIEGLRKRKIIYRGFVYFGLMNVDGDPYVIEYNVRLGDPEAEVVVPRIDQDIVPLFQALATGNLGAQEIGVMPESVATVMLVSGGYPGSYEKGKEIVIPEEIPEYSVIFHAGTKEENGRIVTAGGRVLAISSYGKNMHEALTRSYELAEKISFEKKYYRKDIGFDLT